MKNNLKVSRNIRRDQIVKATLRIVAKKGMGGLTTAAIAHEVSISEANLYRHFKGKDEILSETVERIGEDLIKNLEDALSIADSPLDRLKNTFVSHLDYIEKNGGIPRLVFSEEIHAGDMKLKERLLAAIGSYSTRLETLVREGQKAGSIRTDIEPKATALMFVGIIQMITLRWTLSGFSFSLAHEGVKLWKNFEKCIKGE